MLFNVTFFLVLIFIFFSFSSLFIGFGGELLTFAGDESSEDSGAKNVDKSHLKGYKSVINSKATEESLVSLHPLLMNYFAPYCIIFRDYL